MPILGICRGAQALNVACGGTLHQHVAGPPPDRAGDREPTHEVDDRAGSRLRRIVGARAARASTPSTTRRSTGSATACASSRRAADGTIEAIEGAGFVARRPVARRDAGRRTLRAVRGARFGAAAAHRRLRAAA